MADLVDRIQQELRERLERSRAAVFEYERLQQALSALDGDDASRPAGGHRPGAQVRRRARARRARQPGRTRAPRGANREAVLRVLGERPGASASELAAASGVNRATLYNLLRALKQRGEIESVELPAGSSGYRLLPAGRQPANSQAPSASRSPRTSTRP